MFASQAEHEKRGGVYVIRNLITQKEYVGSAVCIARRIERHIRDLRGTRHHSEKLQRSWDKHGSAAFSFDVLAIVDDPKSLLACEQEWLDALDTVEHGYNVLCTAGSGLGFKHTPETRQRISEAKRGKPMSAEHRAAMRGKLKSAEHRAAMRGRTFSAETRLKMSVVRKGKPLSAECCAAMSAAHKGKPLSAEHRAALQGRKHTLETRAKISAAHKGKLRGPLSAEHRAAISKACKTWSAARAAARA